MPLRIVTGTFVFEVEYDGGAMTLDFVEGVSAWPESMMQDIPIRPKAPPHLRMTAANSSPIENLGTKIVSSLTRRRISAGNC